MTKFWNYLGQLRLYSLVDVVLLLLAAGARGHVFVGAILLWISFLAFLELQHQHDYRASIPPIVPWLLAGFGLILFGKVEGFLYLLSGYAYGLKKDKNFGLISPIFRGMQSFFLGGGIIGYYNPLTWLVLGLLVIRNAAGDARDVEKDRLEGMKTWPMILGLKKNIKYVHLAMVMITSLVWWWFADIALGWLVSAWLIEVASYNLTPR